MGSLHSSRQSAAVLLEAAELQTEDAAAEDARMESLQKEQRAAGQHGHRAKEVREASSPTPALASIKPSSLAWEIGLPRTYLALIQPGLLKTFKHFQLQPALSEVTNHHLMKGGLFLAQAHFANLLLTLRGQALPNLVDQSTESWRLQS